MSSDTLQTSVEVTPDQGHKPTPEERLAAISGEAIAEMEESGTAFGPSGSDEPLDDPAEEAEVADAEGEPSEEEADEPAEDDEPDEAAADQAEEEGAESEDVADAKPVGIDWDGDPDTVPDELRTGYDRQMKIVNKGVNKLMRELADERKQTQALAMQYQQAMLDMQQAPKQQQSSPVGRPELPSEGATQADWQKYEEDNFLYLQGKHGGRQHDEQTSGLAQQVAELKYKTDLANRVTLIANQPGATDEVLLRMQAMAAEDDTYLQMYQSDEGAIRFFKEAKLVEDRAAFELEKAEILKKASESEKVKATRKAGAAGRASPRPGSAKAATSPESNFKKKVFGSVEEKLAYLSKEARAELGI